MYKHQWNTMYYTLYTVGEVLAKQWVYSIRSLLLWSHNKLCHQKNIEMKWFAIISLALSNIALAVLSRGYKISSLVLKCKILCTVFHLFTVLTPEIFFNNGREINIAYLQIVTEIMSSTGGVSFKPKMNPQTSVTVYTGVLKLVQNIAPLIVTCTYAIKGNLKFMSPYWL